MKKNVIITGASGNLGRAAVERFVKDGYFVIAIILPGSPSDLDKNDNVATYPVDLSDEKSVNDFIETVAKRHGPVDVALLLVGGFAAGGLSTTDGAQIRKMIALNFETAYYCARPIFLQMTKQSGGGRIVLVGSKPALEPKTGKNVLAYSLSKSMLFTLAEILNAEGQEKNIVTSVIVPSTIDTKENRLQMPKADVSLWVKPEEIAQVLAFVTSANAHPVADPVIKIYGNRRSPSE